MYKKIFGAMFAAVALTSCTEDFTADWTNHTTEAEEAAKHIQLNLQTAEPIVMAEVTDDSVQVFTYNISSDEPISVQEYFVVLTEGEKTIRLNAGKTGKVATADLEAAVKELYGRRPVAREIAAQACISAKVGTLTVEKREDTKIIVTPDAPVIEEAYYVTGTINGWDNNNTDYVLVNGGGDVYDDPVFTCTIPAEVVTSDLEFKLTPKSGLGGDWSGCLTAGAADGVFADKNAGGNFYCAMVGDAKFYKLTFDMLEMTYSIVAQSFGEFFYAIGGDTGWSSCYTLYGPAFDGKYMGFGYLSQAFKFRPNADNWDNDLEYNGEGQVSDNGGDNCPAPEAAFYQINLDASAGTYNLVKIEKVGVIGDFNSWADGEPELSYNVAEGCWEGDVTFADATKYKFRANGNWTINWGGEAGALWCDGADISAEAGTYNFKLYLTYNGNSHVTITKK